MTAKADGTTCTKTAVQPRLTSCIIVAGVNRFVVDVSVMTAEASDLLGQSGLGIRHEFLITAIP